MKTKKKIRQSSEDKMISSIYKDSESTLAGLLKDLSLGKTLHKSGVDSGMTLLMRDMLNDPMPYMDIMVQKSYDVPISILNSIVGQLLLSHKEKIHTAYFCGTKEDMSLHYAIILKDSSISSKIPFLKFLEEYDAQNISRRIPIYFHFVSEENSRDLMVINQINFTQEHTA